MSTVFIAVMSFTAYATGAVLARRAFSSRVSAAVHPLEVFVVAAIFAGVAAQRRPHYSLAYCALWLGAIVLIGAAMSRATLVAEGRASAGMREFEEPEDAEKPASLWQRWLSFSRATVDHEFRLLLVACYLIIIGPFAIAFRLLRAKPASEAASSWTPRSDTPSLDSARRPF